LWNTKQNRTEQRKRKQKQNNNTNNKKRKRIEAGISMAIFSCKKSCDAWFRCHIELGEVLHFSNQRRMAETEAQSTQKPNTKKKNPKCPSPNFRRSGEILLMPKLMVFFMPNL
jgi:hypothetical protein